MRIRTNTTALAATALLAATLTAGLEGTAGTAAATPTRACGWTHVTVPPAPLVDSEFDSVNPVARDDVRVDGQFLFPYMPQAWSLRWDGTSVTDEVPQVPIPPGNANLTHVSS